MDKKEFYRHRLTFKRRVISRIYTNRFDLVIEEQRWLDMIKREEVGTRYYNRIESLFLLLKTILKKPNKRCQNFGLQTPPNVVRG